MLLDASGARAVSAQGWNDRGALWLFDAARGGASLVPLGDFQYLVPLGGDGERFAVCAQRPRGGWVVSVRTFDAPTDALAEAELTADGRVALRGEGAAWRDLPRVTTGRVGGEIAYSLLVVAEDGSAAEAIPLNWFGAGYDLDYQGVLMPVALPATELVVIPIQRDSAPVVFDLTTRRVRGTFPLAGRNGNPSLVVRGAHLWADDYDTLLRVRLTDLTVEASAVLQDPDGEMGQFIGGWTFAPDGRTCVVGRPFSGDVVAVDVETLAIVSRAPMGHEPLDPAVLADGTVIARDWKTGELLRGELA